MNTKTETQGSNPLDTVKLVATVLILVAGVIGFYWYEDQPTLYRVVGILAAVVIAAALAYTTELGKAFWAFAQEARIEVRKVVWPTRTETIHTTLIVIGMVLVASILLWLIDMFFGWGFAALTGRGG